MAVRKIPSKEQIDIAAKELEALHSEAEPDPVVTARVPKEWNDRADRLVERMMQDDEVRAFMKPNRAAVIRRALVIGLGVLEKTYGVKRKE